MMRKGLLVFLATLIGAVLFSPGVESKKDVEEEAVETAKSWLALVDEGDYEKSWEEAAKYFKSAVTMDKWVQSMNAFRKPLGEMKSREVKSKQYATSLPGAPDGEYVVIQFSTSFDKKKSAIETVTPMLDDDGKWRVSGYYIK